MTAARGTPPSWQTYVPRTGGAGTGPGNLPASSPAASRMQWMWPTGGEIPPDELPPWHPHLRPGAALLDHAARGGSLLHGQEVRHEGHPVLRGVRPDALVA